MKKKNWKTTLLGVLAGSSVILSGQCQGTEGILGLIPHPVAQYANLGLAAALMVFGAVAKDADNDEPKKVDPPKSE